MIPHTGQHVAKRACFAWAESCGHFRLVGQELTMDGHIVFDPYAKQTKTTRAKTNNSAHEPGWGRLVPMSRAPLVSAGDEPSIRVKLRDPMPSHHQGEDFC